MKTMVRSINKTFLIFVLVVGITACHNSTRNKKEKALGASVPKPGETEIQLPKKLKKVANFLTPHEIDSIVNLKTYLPNGKERPKGIKPVPQDGDDFRRAMLDNVYWNGVHVTHADFRGASMRSAKCSETNFSYSDFRAADVRWTLFDRSLLMHCDFSQAKLFHDHVTDSRLDSSDFQGTNMFGMTGHRASLRYCNFSNALMKDVEFTHADFSHSIAVHTRFIRGVLSRSRFDDCRLTGSDFTGAGLEGASFHNAVLKNVSFGGAHLQEADFTGADLEGCNFYGAEMRNTIFKEAKNIPPELKKLIKNGQITGVIAERKNE